LAVCKNTAAVITANQIQVYQNSALLKSIPVTGFTPTAVAIDPSGMDVAVGGDDMKVHFYSISSGTSNGLTIEGNRGEITCLAYSPDNKYLAVGDSNSKILVFDPKNGTLLFDQWVFHSSRINSVSWNQDSVHAVSTSLDTNVEIWSTVDPMKHISIKNAHLESATAASFLDEKTIVSVGGDAFIRTWKIQF
jgi:WD40 repeat protein